MTTMRLLALAAAMGLASPAIAGTVRFDFGGVVESNNIGLTNGAAYSAQALFETDAPVSGTTIFGDTVFAGALTGFSLTLGGETVTSRALGDVTQDLGGAGAGANNTLTINLGREGNLFVPTVDGLDGTIAGREAFDFASTIITSFADAANVFTDQTALLNAVAAGSPVTLGPLTFDNSSIGFLPAAPGGARGFAVLDIDTAIFTFVEDGVPGPDPEPDPLPNPIPLPASGLLLLGGLAALGLRRKGGRA